MRLRNKLNGYEYEAALSTESSASSYGQPVLVDLGTGEAIDRLSAGLTEILEASAEELEALEAAGYVLGNNV